jgi:putative endonuclease
MARNREKAEQRGRLAELSALFLMRLKGYRLLARRFKTGQGEIDLIMRKGDTTAFIEVKARSSHDAAFISVTTYQSRRITAAAGLWMARDQASNRGPCRFDIVTVNAYLWPSHTPNAFPGAS